MNRQLSELVVNDEVAIMPNGSTRAADVVEVGRLTFVGCIYVQVSNGWLFSAMDGRGLNGSKGTYIVPATDEHRAAVRHRS